MNNKIKSLIHGAIPNSIKDRFFADEISRRFAKGAFWLLSGNLISKGLSLIATIFVARYLGKVEYGELGLIRNTLSVFSLVATFGLGLSVNKFIAECRDKNPEQIGGIIRVSQRISFIASIVLATLLILFADYLAVHTLNAPHLGFVLKLSSLYLIFNAINVTQTGALAGLEAYKAIAKVNFIVGIASFPMIIIGAKFYGVQGVIVALVLNMGINCLINKIYLDKELIVRKINKSQELLKQKIKEILRFSVPIAMTEGIYAFSTWGISTLMVYRFGYGELGMYNAASQWSNLILFLPGILSSLVLSMLSNQNTVDAKSNFGMILSKNLKLNGFITLFLAVVFSLLSPVIESFYGADFEGLSLILSVIVFSTIPVTIGNVLYQVMLSKGFSWMAMLCRLLRQLSVIVLFLVLINHVTGALALAISYCIGYSVIIVLQYVLIKKAEFNL